MTFNLLKGYPSPRLGFSANPASPVHGHTHVHPLPERAGTQSLAANGSQNPFLKLDQAFKKGVVSMGVWIKELLQGLGKDLRLLLKAKS